MGDCESVAIRMHDRTHVLARFASKDDEHTCMRCAESVFVRRGEIRRPHFAHFAERSCAAVYDGADFRTGETYDHETAKLYMRDNVANARFVWQCRTCSRNLCTPFPAPCAFAQAEWNLKSEAETDDDDASAIVGISAGRGTPRYRPDVALFDAERRLVGVIEIRHMHAVPKAKRDWLLANVPIVVEVQASTVLSWMEEAVNNLDACSTFILKDLMRDELCPDCSERSARASRRIAEQEARLRRPGEALSTESKHVGTLRASDLPSAVMDGVRELGRRYRPLLAFHRGEITSVHMERWKGRTFLKIGVRRTGRHVCVMQAASAISNDVADTTTHMPWSCVISIWYNSQFRFWCAGVRCPHCPPERSYTILDDDQAAAVDELFHECCVHP
jgi:hypothetical protein